jgi:hypothetical protein
MQTKLTGALLALAVAAITVAPALARGNDFVIKDGFGEEIQIRNGFFGRKTKVVKDRLGNGYSSKTGLFGTREQDVNILGNTVKRKKGLFGGSDIQGSTIFGDKVTTKKGIFGRRTTTIDASGISSVARNLWTKNKDSILGKPSTAQPNSTNNSYGSQMDSDVSSQGSAMPADAVELGSIGNSN